MELLVAGAVALEVQVLAQVLELAEQQMLLELALLQAVVVVLVVPWVALAHQVLFMYYVDSKFDFLNLICYT
jgi:hypothetical protein